MCGIAGWVSPRGNVTPKPIENMLEVLAHRGPDGRGVWANEARTLGLGHNRLAIIDLSEDANQPMASIDDDVTIAFNGEIYNHHELRQELLSEGKRFKTHSSDTEVLINGYQVWGLEKLLSKLIGMFAFSLFDKRQNKLFLVRDRVGIKPLSILRSGENVYFASEIKAFRGLDDFRPTLDRENLYHHLSFRSLPAPRSLFQGVEKLKPATVRSIDLSSGQEDEWCYWNPLDTPPSQLSNLADAADEVERLLQSAIDYRLVSDVPVGVFLSGGVDSTYLLSSLSQRSSNVLSYTATFPGHPDYCEGDVAKEFAAFGNSHHTEVPVTEAAFIDLLPRIAHYQDEPISAPICIPVYMLSAAAGRAGTKVILTGEGSDELFVGYESWKKVLQLSNALSHVPKWMHGPLAKLGTFAASPLGDVAHRGVEFLNRIEKGQPLFWGGAMDFSEREKRRLLGPDFLQEFPDTYTDIIDPIWQEYTQRRDPSDVTGWMSYMDLRFRLPELMLPRVDKMGMASSIEGRVPFLDHRLIEFYLSLSPSIREKSSMEGKGIFKSIAAERLGHDFVYQKKRGFQAPVKDWKTGAFGQKYNPLLLEFSRRTGVFHVQEVERLLERKNDRLYFGLINFMLWHLNFIEDVLPDSNLFSAAERG